MTNRFTFILTIALTILGGAGFITLQVLNQFSPAVAAVSPMLPMTYLLLAPTPDELALALHRGGLDPTSLAAAGLASADVEALVSNASNHLTEHAADLTTADNAFIQARFQVDQLTRIIQSGAATEGDLAAHAAAQSALASATAARQAAVGDLFNAAAANLTQEQKNTLTVIAANRQRDLPLPYLVVHRSDAEWVDLRNALANVRIAQASNLAPDPQATLLLETVDSDPAVANAAAALATNLNAIHIAWNQQVQP